MKSVFEKMSYYLMVLGIAFVLVQCDSDDETEMVPQPDPETEVEGITLKPGMDLCGIISDQDGNPVSGVVVTDGFSCVLTDSDGIYQMKKDNEAKFVYYSTPADYKVATYSETNNVAKFYTKLSAGKRYDFKLEKLPVVETEFTLTAIGDPQPYSSADFNRFNAETIEDLSDYFNGWSEPVYSIVLGDLVSDSPGLYGQMHYALGTTNMTTFTAIGNHDKTAQSNKDLPRTSEKYMSTFGPVNYSFNRGDVHFVCLDNVIYSNSSSYSGGFLTQQIAWLQADLSHVSKDKMIIVYYHIPLRGSESIINRNRFLQSLEGFAEVHLMSGHTHYNENFEIVSQVQAYEHVHAAACGSWWKSTINGDGTPNGYAVYEISGATIKNWYYKPTFLAPEFQIRLHKGDAVFGGSNGFYSYDLAANSIIANVWNADKNWKIEAYEDGVKVANLTRLSDSLRDAWSLGYHIGVLNRNPKNYSPPSKHLFLHRMVNSEAELEIRATDPFGNVYKQNEIVSDYSSAVSY
uniref:calcineurin-like phosphoesterase family protein n=1 Tax=uncultured Draconibacterium sp. TaxID=1573823 RepID=UPI0032163AF9